MVYANHGAIAFIAGMTYITMVVESCMKASKVGLGKFFMLKLYTPMLILCS